MELFHEIEDLIGHGKHIEKCMIFADFYWFLTGRNWPFEAVSGHREHQKRVRSINFIQFKPPKTPPGLFGGYFGGILGPWGQPWGPLEAEGRPLGNLTSNFLRFAAA